MNVSFQTPSYCFEANFNASVTAKTVMDALPIDSTISMTRHSISFKIDINSLSGEVFNLVNEGDVVYSLKEKSIYIYFSPLKMEPDNSVVKIGSTVIDPVAIGKMKSADPMRIMSISPEDENKKASEQKTDIPANRKLTQSEIDNLVQQLLGQKNKDSK